MRKEVLIWCTGVGHSRLQTEPGQSPELQQASLTVLLCSHLYNGYQDESSTLAFAEKLNESNPCNHENFHKYLLSLHR